MILHRLITEFEFDLPSSIDWWRKWHAEGHAEYLDRLESGKPLPSFSHEVYYRPAADECRYTLHIETGSETAMGLADTHEMWVNAWRKQFEYNNPSSPRTIGGGPSET